MRARHAMALVLLAACDRTTPASNGATPRPRRGPPADAMAMRAGPFRGQRLSLTCQGDAGERHIRVGETALCRPAVWKLVTQDTESVTSNFEPYWHAVPLLEEPYVLTADDTSIVRTAGFLVLARREGRTTVRATVGGVEAHIAIEVTPAPRIGWDWPVRDTVVPAGEWVELRMVLRDATAEDARIGSYGHGHTFYADSGNGAAPTLEWNTAARRVRLRSTAPGCVIVNYFVGGSTALTHVHFATPLRPPSQPDSTRRVGFDRGGSPLETEGQLFRERGASRQMTGGRCAASLTLATRRP